MQKLKDFFVADHFGFEIVSLASIFGIGLNKTDCDVNEEVNRHKLVALFASLGADEAEDLRWNFKIKILIEHAKKLNCSRIVLGSSSNRLAESVLNGVIGGRGANIPLVVAEQWQTKTISVVRPLKTLSRDMLCFYSYVSNLPVTFRPLLRDNKSTTRLTRDFLNGLQAITLSTISNVVHAAEKLSLPEEFNHYIALPENPAHTKSARCVLREKKIAEPQDAFFCEVCNQCVV